MPAQNPTVSGRQLLRTARDLQQPQLADDEQQRGAAPPAPPITSGNGDDRAAAPVPRGSRRVHAESLSEEHEQLNSDSGDGTGQRHRRIGRGWRRRRKWFHGPGWSRNDKAAGQHQQGSQLFLDYEAPYDRTDIPFEPTRTLDVDEELWRFYTEEGTFYPRSLIGRIACWLGACRLVRLFRRHEAKHNLRAQQAGQADDDQDVESGQHESEDGQHAGKGAAALRGGRGDAELPPDGVEHEAGRRRFRSIFGLPMLSPEDPKARMWDGFMSALDLTYTAFLVPLSLAFDDMEGTHFTWFNAVNCVGTVLYLADLLVSFHIGFIVAYDVRRELVMQGPKVAEYYIRHGSFYLDCVTILPIVPELVFTNVPRDTTAYKWFYALRLLRLARVFNLLKVWGGSVFTNTLSRWALRWCSTATLFICNLVVALALLVNLMGCLWWFVAELEGLQNSWANYVTFNYSLLDAPNMARWAASVYYAMATMSSVGYGDVVAVTVAEQLVATAFMAFSVFYFGFIVNFVGDLIHSTSHKARHADVLRHKMEDVESWMEERHIKQELQDKVRRFYLQVWAPHAGIGDSEYFDDLPIQLRGAIVCDLAGEALRKSRMFRLLDKATRAQLASVARPVRLVAGHNLFEEGDEADSFYILQEGEALVLHGTRPMRCLHGPALVGQAAVFEHYVEECSTRLHTLRARTNCTLWQFRGLDLAKMLRYNPRFLPPLCDSYLQYLDELQDRMRDRGHAPPKRIKRIQREVAALRDKVARKLARHSREPGPMPPLSPPGSSPEASPPSTPRKAGSNKSGSLQGTDEGGGGTHKRQQQQQRQQGDGEQRKGREDDLQRQSGDSIGRPPSEAMLEDEQLAEEGDEEVSEDAPEAQLPGDSGSEGQDDEDSEHPHRHTGLCTHSRY